MGLPGSQRSVQQLVDEHYVSLYRYGYRLSGSAADAEDLTQEAFCKAQLQMGQLRDPEAARRFGCSAFFAMPTYIGFVRSGSTGKCRWKTPASCLSRCLTPCPK